MANEDHMLEDVRKTADRTVAMLGGVPPQLALLVSCVGRRHVLGQRTEDEIDAVAEACSGGVPITGFYSYGELCTSGPGLPAELHNETMTISMFAEV